jgi:two-component system, OmpR family, sensor histidine kinase VicK
LVSDPGEKTEVVYDQNEIIRRAVNTYYDLKYSCNVCADSIGPSMFVIPNHPVTKGYQDMKRRGIRIRFISEITKDNISSYKELMKTVELRHLDEVKGNFGIGDSKIYQASAKNIGSSPPPLLIESTVKDFVEQQQYFFDMLWRKAIPAKNRIKEIEDGLKREVIETIQDPIEIQNLVSKIISSATEEVDMVFSTANTFKRYEKEGIIELLTGRVNEDGLKFRILVNQNYEIQESIDKLMKMHPRITIKNLDKSVQTKVNTIVADNELSLVIELRDDTQLNNNDAIGLATYSNSESTVLSYASIFETLWLSQTKIAEPNK